MRIGEKSLHISIFESNVIYRSCSLFVIALFVSTLVLGTGAGLHPDIANSGITRSVFQSAPVGSNITLSVPSQETVQVGAVLTFTANATDLNNPTRFIYLSASGLPFGATFPVASSGNPISGTLSWDPVSNQGPGNYAVTFQAAYSQNSSLVTKMVLIEVLKLSKLLAPVLTVAGPQTITPGTLLSFAIVAVDPNLPPSQVNLTVTGLPRGSSFDSSTSVFSWKPTVDQAPGVYVLVFSARDVNGVVGSKVTISVLGSSTAIGLPQTSLDYLAFTPWLSLGALGVAVLYIFRLKRKDRTNPGKFMGREITPGISASMELAARTSNQSTPTPVKK